MNFFKRFHVAEAFLLCYWVRHVQRARVFTVQKCSENYLHARSHERGFRCSEVFHRRQGRNDARHIRYRCVFMCTRFYIITPRRRLYECWLPRRGSFPQLSWLPVCSVSRSLTLFANQCAHSACRVYVMCGLRTQRSYAHPANYIPWRSPSLRGPGGVFYDTP